MAGPYDDLRGNQSPYADGIGNDLSTPSTYPDSKDTAYTNPDGGARYFINPPVTDTTNRWANGVGGPSPESDAVASGIDTLYGSLPSDISDSEPPTLADYVDDWGLGSDL